MNYKIVKLKWVFAAGLALVLAGVALGTEHHGDGDGDRDGGGGGNNHAPPVPPAPPPPPYVQGSYNVTVAGSWNGTGNAAVGGGSISLTCSVTDANGQTGTLNIPSMTIDATNHFTGTGTVLGQTVTVYGRAEPCPASTPNGSPSWHIFARFYTSDGSRIGVIAGFS